MSKNVKGFPEIKRFLKLNYQFKLNNLILNLFPAWFPEVKGIQAKITSALEMTRISRENATMG